MQSSINTIATQTLNRIDDSRKLKARCGLDDDTLRVSIVAYHGNTGLDAIVHNGDGSYEVYLSERVASCTCKDHEFRHILCKHISALCFFLLGTTTPEAKETFSLGQKVQLRGLPARAGKIVCMSHETISVSFPAQEMKIAFTAPYHVVELEQAA